MSRPRLLVLSSLLPAATYGGPVLLHRHLVERGDFEILSIGPDDVAEVGERGFIGSVADRLRRTRFSQFAKDYDQLFRFRKLPHALSRAVDKFAPEAVLTVAHGSLFQLARNTAETRDIPLVSIFHDWWPYLATKSAGVSNGTARRIERRFRDLYKASDCVMPICEGMREELGEHPNAVVIPPVGPLNPVIDNATSGEAEKFVYMGNMTSGYGMMLQKLLSSTQFADRFRLFGNSTDWDPVLRKKLIDRGVLSPTPKPERELTTYLSKATALIVTLPMNGDPEICARTSFPSKLVSYLQYGRPIVFWGSQQSSLVKWAKSNKATAVFTSESPEPVLEFLERLKDDPALVKELEVESKKFAQLLDGDMIQRRFVNAIREQIDIRGNSDASKACHRLV